MQSYRALVRYLRPYWVAAVAAPLLMALEVAMDLAQPRLLQRIVDSGIAHRDMPLVLHTGALMVAAALVGLVGGAGCTVYATIAALRFGADIRGDLFRKVQSLACANLDRLETGRVVTRLTSDVDQVQEAMAMFLRILVRAPLLVVGSLVMAVITSPSLSVLIAALCPLLILLFLLLIGKARPLFTVVQERLDRVNTVLQENLAGVRVVKAFVRNDREIARFGVANDDLMATTIRASTVMASARPAMMLIVNLGVVGVIWFGGGMVLSGRAHVGQVLAFTHYLTQMLQSLMMVAMLLVQVARADASAARILEVLRAEPAVRDAPDALPAPPEPRGRVQFQEVDFRYDTHGEPVLRGVSFTAQPGETVAILGATGSGKSTLVNLVARLYDVTAGEVRLDGVDVRRLTQHGLHGLVSMVPQETILFSGTVRDNIRFGRPDATDAEVEEAARLAQAHDFITALPQGYDTVLGQRGTSLSGGQRQRIAIARALVCRPRVLVLDDCTSSVDGATEALILKNLNAWRHRCTRLI
ncbi:MAG: ABC transporter ATP-binding protein, partial [Armatimonadota bacterium]|nr:ABC transporter ATP-binding protein [Armatimonadota bacterium]